MGMNVVPALFMASIVIAVYFVPSIVAHFRQHHNFAAIVATNVLLGWTALGWIVALVWALTAVRAPAVAIAPPSQ